MKVPTYFKAPLAPRSSEKKARTIPVSDLVAFGKALKANGEYDLSSEALGAPVRAAVNKDGSARLSYKGERIDRVVPEIRGFADAIMDNMTAGWKAYGELTKKANPEAYADVESATAAAAVTIIATDMALVADAKAARAKAIAAEKAKADLLAQAEAAADNAPETREPVTA